MPRKRPTIHPYTTGNNPDQRDARIACEFDNHDEQSATLTAWRMADRDILRLDIWSSSRRVRVNITEEQSLHSAIILPVYLIELLLRMDRADPYRQGFDIRPFDIAACRELLTRGVILSISEDRVYPKLYRITRAGRYLLEQHARDIYWETERLSVTKP